MKPFGVSKCLRLSICSRVSGLRQSTLGCANEQSRASRDAEMPGAGSGTYRPKPPASRDCVMPKLLALQ